jgi:hypothetical protein
MPLGIPDPEHLRTRSNDGAARAADRREGSLVHGATDTDLLVDARPVRAPPDAELRQGRSVARRGRRAPSGSGRRTQHEFRAGRSPRAGSAHIADSAREESGRFSRSSRPRRTRRGNGFSATGGRCARFREQTRGSGRPDRGSSPAFLPRETTSIRCSSRSVSRPRGERTSLVSHNDVRPGGLVELHSCDVALADTRSLRARPALLSSQVMTRKPEPSDSSEPTTTG